MADDQTGRDHTPSRERSFTPGRKFEDSAGATGEDRKRAVDADRTGGGERSETKPRLKIRK